MTSADVLAAILAVRNNPANAAYFATAPSNYLGGMKNALTTGQLQQVVGTGTVNVLAGGNLYHVTPGTGANPFNYTLISNNPGPVPSPSVSFVTPTPTQTTIPNNTSNPTSGRSLGDSLKSGLEQAKTFLGPTGIIIGFGLLAFLVLKK